jgi:uncharacterized protein (DUF1499 family)
MTSEPAPALPLSRLAQTAFYGGLVVVILALAMGPLHRFGVIDFGIARQGLTLATFLAPVVVIIGLAGLYHARSSKGRRGWPLALAGMGGAVLVAGFIAALLSTAKSLPMIHDITTDTDDPPAFEAVLALRGPGTNDPAYAGPSIAQQQKAAYPDIQPHHTDLTPAAAFEQALRAARALKWQVVAATPASDEAAGRIEAVDTTLWFGFKDDVVIRIRPTSEGSVVDVRSASRIGLSDLGANAMRIRRFLAVFDDVKDQSN